MLLAILLFLATYVLLLLLPDHRYIVALCSAALFILLGILPVQSALRRHQLERHSDAGGDDGRRPAVH
jgi:Na+/H+ antiporter NhaD/arsenite permease-like protein